MRPIRPKRPRSSERRAFLRAGAGAAVGLAVGGGAAGASGAAASAREADPPPFALDLRARFGAVGDGVADDTQAVQAAFDAMRTTAGVKGATLYVPPGEYRLTDTIHVKRFAGIVQGPGVGNTPNYRATEDSRGEGAAFRWDGATSRSMFEVRDSRHLTIRDLRFTGSDAHPPQAALDFRGEASDTIGTNQELLVQDCVFGVWPWPQPAPSPHEYMGLLGCGILFDGDNGNNDQFRIVRCTFRGKRGHPTVGVALRNTQTLWGSLTDCYFVTLSQGLFSAASTSMFNPQFLACETDITLESTAQADVFAWNSEQSQRLASVAPRAALRVTGGYCQISEFMMPGRPGGLVSAFPSDAGQTVSFTGTRFPYTGTLEGDSPKPTITFGPAAPHASSGRGFLVKVQDCIGLYPEQCEMVGTMYASDPRSRGLVEWYSRNDDGIVQFRNELWNGGGPGTRTSVDTAAWDQPLAGTTD